MRDDKPSGNPAENLSRRLRTLLEDDTGSAEEAAGLLPTVERLRKWSAPQPTPEDTARLISRLHKARRIRPAPMLLLRAQLYVIGGEIWWASLLMVLLGIVVSLALQPTRNGGPDDALNIPLALVAPLVAAVGVALLYTNGSDSAAEIEHASPTPMLLILLARLTLVCGFNLTVALAGSAVLALILPGLALADLIGAWLAPMTFLSAFAFLVSVLTFEPVGGALSGLIAWATLLLLRLWKQMPLNPMPLPDLLAAETRLPLFIAGLVLFAVALWLGSTRLQTGQSGGHALS